MLEEDARKEILQRDKQNRKRPKMWKAEGIKELVKRIVSRSHESERRDNKMKKEEGGEEVEITYLGWAPHQ